jgi:4-amino-4-deoxy-L-arabinose transferase-like glycosyltransferase
MTATIIFVLAGIYCLARGVMDLRARRWVWGALGLVSGIGILAAPVPTQVQVTIPAPQNATR